MHFNRKSADRLSPVLLKLPRRFWYHLNNHNECGSASMPVVTSRSKMAFQTSKVTMTGHVPRPGKTALRLSCHSYLQRSFDDLLGRGRLSSVDVDVQELHRVFDAKIISSTRHYHWNQFTGIHTGACRLPFEVVWGHQTSCRWNTRDVTNRLTVHVGHIADVVVVEKVDL